MAKNDKSKKPAPAATSPGPTAVPAPSAGRSNGTPIAVSGAGSPAAAGSPSAGRSAGSPEPTDAQGVTMDGRVPSSMMRSYALLTPDLKQLYMGFYKATYGKSQIDIKHKEYIAIAAALSLGCKGCLEGHLKKAKKHGATPEEISEVIAITLGVAAAAIVDRSDIANFNLGGLFEMPQAGH